MRLLKTHFLPLILILKSQQNRIELVPRPDTALIFTRYRPREPHSARESSRDREMTSDGGGSHRAMPSAVFKTVLTVLMFFICLLHWILYSALAQGLPRLKSAVEIGSLSRGFSCVFTFTRLWAIAASKILRWVIGSLPAVLRHGHMCLIKSVNILLLAPR